VSEHGLELQVNLRVRRLAGPQIYAGGLAAGMVFVSASSFSTTRAPLPHQMAVLPSHIMNDLVFLNNSLLLLPEHIASV
jgi:hypothetical protein